MSRGHLRLVGEPMTDEQPRYWILQKFEPDGSWDGESFWLYGNTKESAEQLRQEMAGEVQARHGYSDEAAEAAKTGKLVLVVAVGMSVGHPWAATYEQLEFDFGEDFQRQEANK